MTAPHEDIEQALPKLLAADRHAAEMELDVMRRLLLHAASRNHEYSPEGCSACTAIRSALTRDREEPSP